MNSPLIPPLPDEVTILIVNPDTFSPAEATLLCLVSKRWRELGQAIIWNHLDIEPRDARSLAPQQLVLFKDLETTHRLGAYVKKLTLRGKLVFTQPRNPGIDRGDDEVEVARMLVEPTLEEADFILSWCRKMVSSCPRLEDLEVVDFHLATFRTIVKQAADSVATSLRHFRWGDHSEGLLTMPYPRLHFTPSQFLITLGSFTSLETVEIHSALPATFAPGPASCLPLRLSTLRLWAPRSLPGERVYEGSLAGLMYAARKETLRILNVNDSIPFPLVVRQLSQPGYDLVELKLHYQSINSLHLVAAVTQLLPFHPNLSNLFIISELHPHVHSLPHSFIIALPPSLRKLKLGISVINPDDAGIEEIRRRVPRLESFVVRATPRGPESDYEWRVFGRREATTY